MCLANYFEPATVKLRDLAEDQKKIKNEIKQEIERDEENDLDLQGKIDRIYLERNPYESAEKQ